MKTSQICLVKMLILLVSVILVLHLTNLSCAVGSDDGISSKIEEAERLVQQAFEAVSEAQRAGANVSFLIMKLDSAGLLLADTEMRYRNGDLVGAINSANLTVQSTKGLTEEAEQLKTSAIAEYKQRVFQTVAASIAAVAVIASGSAGAWWYFKQRYLHKISKMKPEVVEGES